MRNNNMTTLKEYEKDLNLAEQYIHCGICKTRTSWKDCIYDKHGTCFYFTCGYGHKNVLML